MSLYPAATFSNFDPSGPKMIPAGWGSPLYVIHKDITKTLEDPNSINEIINGDETEAQYSVVLNVPSGARGFIPFFVLNYTVSASTAWMAEAYINCGTVSGNPLRYYFMGRVPVVDSAYKYDPFSISMTSAPDPGTIGYWHPVGAVKLAASTAPSVTSNYFLQATANNGNSCASNYSLATASTDGLTRTNIVSTLSAGAGTTSPWTENLVGRSVYYAQTATNFGLYGDMAGVIPLFGATKLTCFATSSSSAPVLTVNLSMGSGTASNVSCGLAVRFVA